MDSLQAQSRTLVDEMISTTQESMNQLDAMGLQIQGLDGSAFTVYASMDGSGMESTVDNLIAKFQQLSVVAAAPLPSSGYSSGVSGSSTNPATETIDEWEDRINNAPDNYNTTVNINQQLSRSDVSTIINEQSRQEDRI